MLHDLGFEVFVPKRIPDSPEFRSGVVTDQYDDLLTLSARDRAMLDAHNFYEDAWSDELTALVNREFEVVIAAMSGYVRAFDEPARWFRGSLIARAFGREHPERYTTFCEGGDPPLRDVIEMMGERFVFGAGYGTIPEIEDPFLRTRSHVIALPPPFLSDEIAGAWQGGGDRAVFLCPGILEAGYYRDLYSLIKADFGDLPHAILGVQHHEIDDPAVLGFVSDDEMRAHLRHMPVFVYPSHENRHVHYTPLEAMIAGAPVLYRAATLLDRLSGRRDLPGRCTSTEEMRAKAQALIAGDRALADAIRAGQPAIASAFDTEVSREHWRGLLARSLSGAQHATLAS